MKTKILLGLLLTLLLLAILAHPAFGAADAKKGKVPAVLHRVDGAQPPTPRTRPSPVMYEGAKVTDCGATNPEVPVEAGHPVTVGFTYYDYQKNGSMGRMIAVGPGGHRHFIFHETRGDYNNYPRYVTYNCFDGASFWVGATWIDGGDDINAGYANILTMHDGREVILYHSTAEEPEQHTKLAVGDEGYVCSGYFTNKYDLPDIHDSASSSAPNGYWPKGCIVYDTETDTDYIHIVTMENATGVAQSGGYLRCVFQGDNLVCHSPGYGPYVRIPNTAFPSPLDKIDVYAWLGTINAVMASSPVSKRVAIVFLLNRDDYSTRHNNDVGYIESTNNGDDWFATGFPAPVNVTDAPAAGTERAYTDVAACYDYNDNLHIVWNGCWYDSVEGLVSADANLYHWSNATGISMIAPGYWEDTAPGAWNRNISKMSISAKDPIYHPGGDPDSVFLFCTWTQFNPGDVSAGGWSNGDIYAAVSNDAGQMWTPGFNLTNTQSPDCHPAECASDHWSSLAENMYGGDLYIQYVCDRDAGGIVRDEGVWTDNDVMYLHVYQLPVVNACGITWGPGDPASFTVPPIRVSPDKGSRAVHFNIRGLFNLGGNFEVTSDHGSVAITGNQSGYLGPGQTKTVEATITCSAEGFIHATITVRGCIGTESETYIDIALYAVCSHDYYECARAANTTILKDNGKLGLWVCSNSGQQLWHRWIQPDENQQIIFYGGSFVATIAADDPSDTVIGRQDYSDVYTGARDTINVLELDDSESGCRIQRIQVKNTYIWKVRLPGHYIRWYWIDIYKQIFMFHDHPEYGPCPHWRKDIIVKHVKMKFSRPPMWWPNPGTYPGHGEIHLGHWADVDAPFDEGCNRCNTAGYDDYREMIWLHGFYNDTIEEPHPEYEDFYVGLAFTDTLGGVVEPLGMQCVRNDSFLYPNDGWGWRTDQFYELITASGENIHDPDSVVDRTVVMTAAMVPAGGPGDTTFQAEYILIEAAVQGVPGAGLQELQVHMDDARGILIPLLDSLGLLSWDVEFPGDCGDIDNNGAVDAGDILVLVNYFFLGYPLPPWSERADVNGDYNIDVADYVYLLNFIFLGDPPALNCPGFPGHTPPSWGDDPLTPDSIHLTVEDCKSTSEGTDVEVTVWSCNDEELLAIMFPLSWSEDAYLDPAKNSLSAGSEYYIFRDYDGVPNRVRPYAESAGDLIFLIDSLNNQSLLFIRGSTNLPPGSGLFATLVFTCDQPTAPLIDTCFFAPCHHLLFIEPNCNYFVPHFNSWEPVDCSRSYSDPCLVACPLGDIPFRVYLKDLKGSPVTNYSNVWLDFSGCSGIVPCPAETHWPVVPPDGPSDENGVITFHVHAGGCNNTCQVSVMAGCGLIGYVSVKTVDVNGDLVVKADDWHNIGGDLCNDYNCNQEVNFWDLDFFRNHILHSCDPDPCLLLSQDLTMHPDTLLPVDSTHTIRLFITNHHSEPCTAQFVKFYHQGFVQDPGLIQFATRYLWQELIPGDTISTEADFVVPGPDTGYVLTKFYTDCCDHSIDAVVSPIPRMCPPAPMVYVFPIVLDIAPAWVETLEYIPDEPGWQWSVYYTGGTPDSVAIVTPDSSVLGVTGGVTLYFFDQESNLLSSRTCEVRITLNSGDMNSDCLVDVADVISLINYLFLGGSAPNPVRAGDVNCDCLLDVADVIYLINYLFLGGSPPVSSETCECGY